MKSYLSIDIDFWNDQKTNTAKKALEKLFNKAKKCGIPIQSVMNHQQLTPFVNKSGADTLINIDTHSDLGDTYVDYFSCGSWVSYIQWRQKGTYIWYHRLSIGEGECNNMEPIFLNNKLPRIDLTDWQTIKRHKVRKMVSTRKLLKNCVAIGFVMSPAYSDDDLIVLFKELVKKYDIPYKKGVLNEDDFSTARRPPFSKRAA